MQTFPFHTSFLTKSLSLSLGALFLNAISYADEPIPMPVELPKAESVGTETPIPADWKYENAATVAALAKPENRPKLPKGSVNLAANKPVSASAGLIGDDYLSYEDDDGTVRYLLTDGDKAADEFSEMILQGDAQWVQIDLEAESEIHALWLLQSHRNQRVFKDVIVQLSNDPEFKEGVKTIFNNDADGSSAQGEGKDPLYFESNNGRFISAGAEPVNARYVRIYCSGNSFEADQSLFVEAEVWGKAK